MPREGYCTILGDSPNEIAWRNHAGHPILHNSKQEVIDEIEHDHHIMCIEVEEGFRYEDDIPEKDEIAWAVNIDEMSWQIQDLNKQNLFIHIAYQPAQIETLVIKEW